MPGIIKRIGRLAQSAGKIFGQVFVSYGAGADRLRLFTEAKWWNTVSWILIIAGIVGWAIFIFWSG